MQTKEKEAINIQAIDMFGRLQKHTSKVFCAFDLQSRMTMKFTSQHKHRILCGKEA
jgi:hypothetical protein